jgi:beta-D-xylosidase 4
MQGNYQGIAPFLVSPFAAATTAGFQATLTQGTAIDTTDTSGFAAAIAAAQAADAIIYAGGIDGSVEGEAHDRDTIVWPGNQLDLIAQLSALGKPLVVLQFGGGQIDGTALKSNSKVRFHWTFTCAASNVSDRSTRFCGVDIQGRAAVRPSWTS